MFQLVRDLLSTDSLSPHGICLTWRPELVWTHVVSDAIIGLSYFSIPVVLLILVLKRPDIGFGWVFWCFSAFILACGTTHFFSIWTLWRPDYGAEALIKSATAAASLATAAALWPLLPTALRIPSPEQLRRVNKDLTRRIAERDEALAALRQAMEDKSRAEEMLRQSQKMEVVGQLAAGVSHDFNNLLTAISMNLARAARDVETGDANARAAQAIARASEATRRAGRLTGQLLAFARKQPLSPAVMDVNDVVRGMSELLAGTIHKESLELRLAQGPLMAELDVNQLENAIINLAMNARDAMQDSPEPKLAIATESDGHVVRLSVTDNGTGMSRQEAERAFEPFFTTKAPGQGTGLGLSQVYGFVQQSGGAVRIDSERGRGTTVILEFPMVEGRP
jgi:signal transduction histidine kinase